MEKKNPTWKEICNNLHSTFCSSCYSFPCCICGVFHHLSQEHLWKFILFAVAWLGSTPRQGQKWRRPGEVPYIQRCCHSSTVWRTSNQIGAIRPTQTNLKVLFLNSVILRGAIKQEVIEKHINIDIFGLQYIWKGFTFFLFLFYLHLKKTTHKL